jgi:hypothetical protein
VTYSYDIARGLPTDLVRLLIPDRTSADPIFQDEELDALLTLEAGSVRLATAQALDTIASDEALVQKVIRLGDLQTNGAATAKELRERAANLRAQAADPEVAAAGDEPFAIAQTAWDLSTARQLRRQQAEATGG